MGVYTDDVIIEPAQPARDLNYIIQDGVPALIIQPTPTAPILDLNPINNNGPNYAADVRGIAEKNGPEEPNEDSMSSSSTASIRDGFVGMSTVLGSATSIRNNMGALVAETQDYITGNMTSMCDDLDGLVYKIKKMDTIVGQSSKSKF